MNIYIHMNIYIYIYRYMEREYFISPSKDTLRTGFEPAREDPIRFQV